MRLVKNTDFFRRQIFITVLSVVFLLIASQEVKAQEPPPRPVVVSVINNLSFGAFYQGPAGGTVTVNSGGIRSKSGDVVLLGMGYLYSAASYTLVANAGTVISLLSSDVSLPGSNGGSMNLNISSSTPATPFVVTTIPPASTTLYVGGTLTVGVPGSNPPGSYSGSFNITFVQE